MISATAPRRGSLAAAARQTAGDQVGRRRWSRIASLTGISAASMIRIGHSIADRPRAAAARRPARSAPPRRRRRPRPRPARARSAPSPPPRIASGKAAAGLPSRTSRSASGRQPSSCSRSGIVAATPCSTITSPARSRMSRSRSVNRSPLRLTGEQVDAVTLVQLSRPAASPIRIESRADHRLDHADFSPWRLVGRRGGGLRARGPPAAMTRSSASGAPSSMHDVAGAQLGVPAAARRRRSRSRWRRSPRSPLGRRARRPSCPRPGAGGTRASVT